MEYKIREIEEADNKALENVIRTCLIEFGANHEGTALDYAKKYYSRCYLETLENMIAAQRFYEKYGFERIFEPLVKTDHFACDVRYVKDLNSMWS